MATYTLSPVAKQQFLDNSGNPLANGRIYTYVAGTTTALSTYQTSSGTAWGAYVQLDSAGRPETGSIYLLPGQSYKFIAQTSAGVALWTQDNIAAVPPSAVNVDITGIAGVNLAAGDVVYMSKGDGALTPGSFYLTDADLDYASSTASIVGMVPAAIAQGDTGTIRLEGDVDVTGPLTPGADYYASATAGGLTATAPANERYIGQAKSVGVITIVPNPATQDGSVSAIVDPKIKALCNGRLSLTTGVPVTVNDVTAATTVYWVPYQGNEVALYTGSAWTVVAQAQLSVAVPATTVTMYDVFLDYNDGTPQLAVLAWTNDTTRATALTTQDGVYVKTGDTQQRYLGSFRTTGVSGQTEDSVAKRYVYNAYNRVIRNLRVLGSGSWTYASVTIRQAGGSAANQLDVVVGLSEDAFTAHAQSNYKNTATQEAFLITIGLDSTTTPATGASIGYQFTALANNNYSLTSVYEATIAVGRHTITWLEATAATGTTTITGSSATDILSGIWGTFRM